MNTRKLSSFNPNPITKLALTVFLACTLSMGLAYTDLFTFGIVSFIALFFALNGKRKTAVRVILFYAIISFLSLGMKLPFPDFVKNNIIYLAVIIKIFYLPILGGKFLIDTTDVSSMMVAMEKLRLPRVFVISLAVMFRYFPVFQNDRKNIKMAMKMRGISFRNPIKYLEYVSVPILISAGSISDDISKAAETKCIADPCKKIRYATFGFGLPDLVLILGVLILHSLGRYYA
ncbi:MAG: energy-coupling factor transporter transmembrane component T [Bacillota bacterium]|nr:energy-coupling factor transporter transmembrane component T [Bacillota bacterium]